MHFTEVDIRPIYRGCQGRGIPARAVPVAAVGRLIAATPVIAVIALLGVVAAAPASWLVERVGEQDEASQAATRAQVAAPTA
ncbi:ion transport protein [Rhodococcus ruber]